MISLEEARKSLLQGIAPLEEELVVLDRAASRVLSRDVVANHNQPSEPRSKMDGIAIGSWSAAKNQQFTVVGAARAGAPYSGVIAADESVLIATGAMIPFGAQRVVPKEIVSIDDDQVATLLEAPPADSFMRVTGADFRKGDVLLAAGTRLHPGALGMVAAANWSSAFVHRRPTVAILSSGDELVAPGSPLRPGATIDSASYVVAALAGEWGGIAHRLQTISDSEDAVRTALAQAVGTFDVVVTVGGASVGERDHFRGSARALGLDLHFERIAIQPGKPCWHARKRTSGLCLGLPGNPNSAFVCSHLLLKPLLQALCGERDLPANSRALLTGGPVSCNERRSFHRGLTFQDGARVLVRAAEDQDSGLQLTLAHANCLVDLPPNARFSAGDEVEIVHLYPAPRSPISVSRVRPTETFGAL